MFLMYQLLFLTPVPLNKAAADGGFDHIPEQLRCGRGLPDADVLDVSALKELTGSDLCLCGDLAGTCQLF